MVQALPARAHNSARFLSVLTRFAFRQTVAFAASRWARKLAGLMKRIALAASLMILASCGASAQTHDELVKGATDTNNVLNHGMGYNLQRFSALKQINKDTIQASRPGLELQLRRQSQRRIQPLVYKGVLYVTTQQRHDGDRRQDRQANLENQG